MEFFKADKSTAKKSRRYYGLLKEVWVTIDENAVRIVTELIAQKDATVIAIMNQEVK